MRAVIGSAFLVAGLAAAAGAQTPPKPPADMPAVTDKQPSTPQVGQPFPDIPALQWFNTAQPAGIRLANLRGRVVVVSVWSTQSKYCLREGGAIDKLKELAPQWQAKKVDLVTVCYEPADVAGLIVEQKGIPFAVAATQDVLFDYGKHVPTMFVIDKNGFITWLKCPIFPSEWEELDIAIRQASGENVQMPAPVMQPARINTPRQNLPADHDKRLDEADKLVEAQRFGEAFAAFSELRTSATDAPSREYAREMVRLMAANSAMATALRDELRALMTQQYLRMARIEAATGATKPATVLYERIIQLAPDGPDALLARQELEAMRAPTTRPAP